MSINLSHESGIYACVHARGHRDNPKPNQTKPNLQKWTGHLQVDAFANRCGHGEERGDASRVDGRRGEQHLCGIRSPSLIAVICTTRRRIPTSGGTNQGPGKGDLIPQIKELEQAIRSYEHHLSSIKSSFSIALICTTRRRSKSRTWKRRFNS